MFNKNSCLKSVVIMGACLMSIFFSVVNAKPYIGVSYSSLDFKNTSALSNTGTPGSGDPYSGMSNSEIDNSGAPLKLIFGMEFAKAYSLEFNYFNIGDFEITRTEFYSNTGVDTNVLTSNEKYSGYGIGLTNVFKIGVSENVDIYAKLGFIFSKGDSLIQTDFVSSDQSDINTLRSGDYSEKTAEFGLGVQYKIAEKMTTYLDITKFPGISKEMEMTAITFGLKYFY